MISFFGDVVLKLIFGPTYTLIMADRLKNINIRRNRKKKQCSARMSAIHDARKKAKLLIPEPTHPGECITCGQIPRDDHRTICGLCGCKNSLIDTSKLDLSGHQAVDQVRFGKDSLKDSDYQTVLSMLPEDMVNDFCRYFVQECSSGKVAITQEELQQRLNLLDTKSIIRKLVAYRRKEVSEKGNGNVHLMRTQLKEMKSQIKSLRKKVSNIRTGGRDKENESENQRNSSINVMENALVGKSFVVEETTVVMMVSLTLITFTMFCVRSMLYLYNFYLIFNLASIYHEILARAWRAGLLLYCYLLLLLLLFESLHYVLLY